MIKATMLAACAAVLALVALPALATSEETENPGDPYLSGLDPETSHFTLQGNGHTTLTGPAQVTCESLEGTGEFEDQEAGWIELAIGGCKGPFGITCTTHEEEAGIVTTTKLPFQLKTVLHEHNESKEGVGVLITTNEGHLASFTCSAFFNIKVIGNGIIGTITDPGEKEKSNTGTFTLEANEAGEQTHRTVTGDETSYDLKTEINGGEAETSSIDSHSTLEFHKGEEPEILTTGEKEETETEEEKTKEEEETETIYNPGDPYLEGLDPETTHFAVEGNGHVILSSYFQITCESLSGEGEFEDQETGWIQLTIQGCALPLDTTCSTTTPKLPFHLKTVLHEHSEEEGIGLLITPGEPSKHEAEGLFATLGCGYHFEIIGNGLIGTITDPGEEERSNTATISFEASEPGVQTHTTVAHDEVSYDTKVSVFGGEPETFSETAHATIKFHEGEEPEILTTEDEETE